MSVTNPGALTVPDPGAYRIDPARSSIGYRGKHLFGLGTVQATFSIREGRFEIASPLTISTATVVVDAGSFTSDSAKRDSDVRGAKLLDVATYPDITFRSDQLVPNDDGWRITGLAHGHGHDVPVTVTIDRVAAEDGGLRIHGLSQHLDRLAFGVVGSRGMAGRWLDLELDVFARPMGGTA